MSGVLRWEEPPSKSEPHVFASEFFAAQLKKRPGEWAVVVEWPTHSGLAGYISAGRYRAFQPAGSFQALLRTVNGVPTVYARYVGEPS